MFALGLVEFHGVHIGSLVERVKVSLDDIPSFQRMNWASQLAVWFSFVFRGHLKDPGSSMSKTNHSNDRTLAQ